MDENNGHAPPPATAIPTTAWSVGPQPTPGPQPSGRTRAAPEPKEVPWTGCPLIGEDMLDKVPANANLRIRLCVAWDGEIVVFNRKPFPINGINMANIQKRWGPAPYVAQLFDVDPNSAAGGLKGKPLVERPFEIRPKDEMDVGDEPWPVDINSPEVPFSMREEYDRRDRVRGGEEVPTQGGQLPFQGFQTPQPSQPSAYDSPAQTGPVVFPTAPAPPRPSFVESLMSKGPDELLAFGVTAVKLLREINPPPPPPAAPAGPDREFERIRQEHDLRMQAAREEHDKRMLADKQAHDLRMAELNAKQTPAPITPVAPPVDVEALRNSLRAEFLQKEVDELRRERAKPQHTEKPTNFMEEIRRIAETAKALGYEKRGGGGGGSNSDAAAPTMMEQLADLLSTPGGQTGAAMILGKLLNMPVPEIPPQVETKTVDSNPAPPQPSEPQILGGGDGGIDNGGAGDTGNN